VNPDINVGANKTSRAESGSTFGRTATKSNFCPGREPL
jgi:hypothetical protein